MDGGGPAIDLVDWERLVRTLDDGQSARALEGETASVDPTGTTISRRSFLTSLAEKGLLPEDPRLHEMFMQLAMLDLPPCGSIPVEELAEIAALGGPVVQKALSGEIAIPSFEWFCELVTNIFVATHELDEGEPTSHIPQLASADRSQFAVSITTVDGQRFSLGDSMSKFSLQSCSAPVTYAIALEENGEEFVHKHVGREPSGRKHNEMALKKILEENRGDEPERTAIPHNPMINAGAIACSSLMQLGQSNAERMQAYLNTWSALCGEPVECDTAVMLAERTAAYRNTALGFIMNESGTFEKGTELAETLEVYFGACSTTMTVSMLATAAATLAAGGVNPLTEERVFSTDTTRMVTSLMLSCGMYDLSGEWAFNVGIPAKSSASGALMLVIPGVAGVAVWSPCLNNSGSSARGVAFTKALVETFAFHHLESATRSKKIDPTQPRLSKTSAGKVEILAACSGGDLRTVKAAYARGGDLNAADYDSRTPLHVAASNGWVNVVEFLLQHGADVDAKDRWGTTAEDSARSSVPHRKSATVESATVESAAGDAKKPRPSSLRLEEEDRDILQVIAMLSEHSAKIKLAF